MKKFFVSIFIVLVFASTAQALTPAELQKIRDEIEIIKLTDPQLAQAMHQELFLSFRRGEFRMEEEREFVSEDNESNQENREEEIERALEEYQDQLSSQRR